MSGHIAGLRQAEIPKMVHVRQTFPRTNVPDLDAAVAAEMNVLFPKQQRRHLLAGKSIGVTVGSRGITAIDGITKAVVSFLREAGASPFIFPAMGSHGGGTAEGQTEMIAGYGVTEEAMGCPILAEMQTSVHGVFDGVEVHCAKVAYEADGILLLNRVKPHTDICKPPNQELVGFDCGGIVGSGLSKICAIGAGKLEGAKAYHDAVLGCGLETAIVVATRELIRAGRVIGGLAILENAYHQTAKLEAVPVSASDLPAFFRHEARLHSEAKALMPRLPLPMSAWKPTTVDPARPDAMYDVLFCRDIGKDISGAGMDTNIVGRGAYESVPGKCWQEGLPSINRVVVSDITPGAHGNPGGPGLADFGTKRFMEKTNYDALYLNQVTSYSTMVAKMPICLENDRVAIAAALATTPPRAEGQRFVAIKNTLELSDVLVSEACLPLLKGVEGIELVGEPAPMVFDAEGYCLFPWDAGGPKH